MKKILVILGATSTGKTDLALKLAEKFKGELVACDSRQIYKGLDIGTGKLPEGGVTVEKGHNYWEMDGIKIWMYDVTDFKKQYTVYDYVKDANEVISEICRRGKLPIIVGGTGLYLKALLEGLSDLSIPLDLKLRKELETLSLADLQKKLEKISPQRWDNMNESDRHNPRRLIRAIEKEKGESGKSVIESGGLSKDYNILKIGLTAPREVLYGRIDERVINRIKQGMIAEAEELHKEGLSFKRMRQLGLEYGILADYLECKLPCKDESGITYVSQDSLIHVLTGKIHGFARRQTTWFKKEKDVYWFDITTQNFLFKLESMVNSWYYRVNDKKN